MDTGDDCCGLFVVLALAGVYIYALYMFFAIAFFPIISIVSIILTGLILYNFSIAFREGINQEDAEDVEDISEYDQPAYKQYFFRKAFIDLKKITYLNYYLNRDSIRDIYEKTKEKLFAQERTWITWPIGVAIMIAIASGVILGSIIYGFVTALHIIVVLLVIAGVLIAAGTLRGVEGLNMARWRIFYACPQCYNKFSMPVYLCPECNAEHTKLVPGQFGLLKRKCRCGNLLPTSFFNGKNSLPSKCPVCGESLTGDIGTSINVHYPIVGGPVSGKSSFLVACMLELEKMCSKAGYDLAFSEQYDKDTFEKAKKDYSSGISLGKTTIKKPRAFLATLQQHNQKRPPHLLYMYDAAGEAFENLDDVRHHTYFEYISGIFFLVDPFSIQLLRDEFEAELKKHENVKPSNEPPNDVIARVSAMLKEQKVPQNRNGQFTMPFAVVVTKSDAFGIEEKISQTSIERQKKTAKGIASEKVRQWLINNGAGNFVRTTESLFLHVGYFACSPLGHIPEDGSTEAFTPRNVDAPMDWVFSAKQILRK